MRACLLSGVLALLLTAQGLAQSDDDPGLPLPEMPSRQEPAEGEAEPKQFELSFSPRLESASLALGTQAWTETHDGPVFLLGLEGQLGQGPEGEHPDGTSRYYLGSFSGLAQTTEAGFQRYDVTLTPLTLEQRDTVRQGWQVRSRSYHLGRVQVVHDTAAGLERYVDFAPFGVEVETVWQGEEWAFVADLAASVGLAHATPSDPRRDTITAPFGGVSLGLSAEHRWGRFGIDYHIKGTTRDDEHDEGRIGGFNAYVERTFGRANVRFQIGKERWRTFAGHTNDPGSPDLYGCVPTRRCHLGGRITQLQVTVPLGKKP